MKTILDNPVLLTAFLWAVTWLAAFAVLYSQNTVGLWLIGFSDIFLALFVASVFRSIYKSITQ